MKRQLGLYEFYGGTPPHVRGNETSLSAAHSVRDTASTMRARVLNAVRTAGNGGLTCDEVESLLDMRHQTASARMRELALKAQIVSLGDKRPTRSGRAAFIWRTPRGGGG